MPDHEDTRKIEQTFMVLGGIVCITNRVDSVRKSTRDSESEKWMYRRNFLFHGDIHPCRAGGALTYGNMEGIEFLMYHSLSALMDFYNEGLNTLHSGEVAFPPTRYLRIDGVMAQGVALISPTFGISFHAWAEFYNTIDPESIGAEDSLRSVGAFINGSDERTEDGDLMEGLQILAEKFPEMPTWVMKVRTKT